MNKEEKYIPRTLVVGETREHAHVVSYKDRLGEWVGLSRFKSLTGYSPGEMRDASKQFKKKVLNAVAEFENSPVEGIKVAGTNRYGFYPPRPGRPVEDVLLKDPRGFTLAFPHETFFKLAEAAGWDFPGGAFRGKYVYVSCNNCVVPAPASGPEYEKLAEDTEKYFSASKTMTGKDFKPGTLCTPAKGNRDLLFMYIGKFDTYSVKYQATALEARGYDFEYDPDSDYTYCGPETKSGRMAFYCMKPGRFYERIALRGTASKAFLPFNGGPGGHFMDDGRPATFENVADFASRCVAFNRFDAASLAKMEMVEATPDEIDYAYSGDEKWPFGKFYSGSTVTTTGGCVYQLFSSCGALRAKLMLRGTDNYCRAGDGYGLSEITSSFKVIRPSLKFENGLPVPGWAALRLYGNMKYNQMSRR